MKRLERLEKKGYKVVTSLNTGNVIVKRGLSFNKVFNSVTAAHRYIFGY